MIWARRNIKDRILTISQFHIPEGVGVGVGVFLCPSLVITNERHQLLIIGPSRRIFSMYLFVVITVLGLSCLIHTYIVVLTISVTLSVRFDFLYANLA